MNTTKSVVKTEQHKPESIELVLGGGGIKGFAHVGFLKAVQKLNINYNMVTGVSIGSIVAVLFVNGFSTSEIEKIFAEELKRINPKKLARSMLLPASVDRLIFGEEPVSLLALMKNLVARYNLKPKANLRLVAFNALTREPVVYTGTRYNLATAMAASCSIPFVFRPIENGEEISIATWVRHWISGKFSFGRGTADGTGKNVDSESELLFDGGLYHPAPTSFCKGPAIVAKLGFASQPPGEDLGFADRLFHNLEKRAASILDAIFPDDDGKNGGGEHIVITVGRADVAALSFGISDKQQKSLTSSAYRRSMTALSRAVAEGRVPVKP